MTHAGQDTVEPIEHLLLDSGHSHRDVRVVWSFWGRHQPEAIHRLPMWLGSAVRPMFRYQVNPVRCGCPITVTFQVPRFSLPFIPDPRRPEVAALG